MAGDWIKMRVSICTHPKVMRIAAMLESERAAGKRLSTGFGGALREIVTRDVTRDVTVASLLRVWGAANEHTEDGVWRGIQITDLDHVAGIPGFGAMMEAVGWAIFDDAEQTVTFPNFLEYNAPAGRRGSGSSAAERQRRYRERQRKNGPESDVTRDAQRCATRDVTRDGREEKSERRNKKKTSSSKKFEPPSVEQVAEYCRQRGNSIDPQQFVNHYEANGWKRGKTPIKDWQACVRTWEGNQRDQQRTSSHRATGREQANADAFAVLEAAAEQQAAERDAASGLLGFADSA